MVSFRRLATAVALLAVFAALAGAQGLPLTCQTNVAVTPTLRAEGYTEQTGDITISCTGGTALTAGSLIPQVNVTLFYNTAVTSRLLPTSASSAISEALLLVDEPGSGISFVNPNQVLCTTPTTGCQEYATTGVQPFTGATGPIYGQCTTFTGATCTGFGAINTIPNVFQGVVSGNAITFFGVPFLAPTTSGSRVLRITNARVNATQLSGGSAAGATPVIASISISGATSLSISNATPTVGFVQGGLTATASSASNQNQCATQTRASINTLTFTENFPTAFKTRVFAQSNVAYAGQGIPGSSGLLTQNIPGSIYNSESNFVYGVSSTQTAGLADFGTRLRAQFNNVPAGVRLFVSTVNVNNNASPITAPAIVGGNVQTQVYAQLVSSETIADGNAGTSGFFPAVTATDNGPSGGNVPIAEIQVVNGSATAVWEVVNTNPNANEAVKFAVYSTYIANPGQNSPPPGTATVNLSFAPAPPTFSASAGAAASSTLTIPRFIADPSAARNILNINICRTILLYPYVTNQAGFDTGLAIANTSTDPFGTSPQAGSCALNWYQGTNNPATMNSGTIASGTVYTTLASTAVPGFQGYMIAVCNFQFAHGFAFISDVGARNLAMGYLALVLPDPASNGGSRNASASGCGATAGSSGGVSCATGEANSH
ncbi:MAG TPA: hypothetical protein VMJ75_10935 [Candidatus Acidoferrales bacterium]|nr:hypothetical protein [Candidatus Acidoferrales bacterium]